MQAANGASSRGNRVVILDELQIGTRSLKRLHVINLREETPMIGKRFGTDQPGRQIGPSCSRTRSRACRSYQ